MVNCQSRRLVGVSHRYPSVGRSNWFKPRWTCGMGGCFLGSLDRYTKFHPQVGQVSGNQNVDSSILVSNSCLFFAPSPAGCLKNTRFR